MTGSRSYNSTSSLTGEPDHVLLHSTGRSRKVNLVCKLTKWWLKVENFKAVRNCPVFWLLSQSVVFFILWHINKLYNNLTYYKLLLSIFLAKYKCERVRFLTRFLVPLSYGSRFSSPRTVTHINRVR